MSYFVVIHGSLGSGKSTTAAALAEKLRAYRVQIDDVLSEHGLDTHDDGEASIPAKNFIKALDAVLPEVQKKLSQGIIIIFDGCFYHKEVMDYLLENLSSSHVVFTLKAPLAVCIERDRHRARTLGEDAARAVFALTSDLDFGYVIHSTGTLEESLKKILALLPP